MSPPLSGLTPAPETRGRGGKGKKEKTEKEEKKERTVLQSGPATRREEGEGGREGGEKRGQPRPFEVACSVLPRTDKGEKEGTTNLLRRATHKKKRSGDFRRTNIRQPKKKRKEEGGKKEKVRSAPRHSAWCAVLGKEKEKEGALSSQA